MRAVLDMVAAVALTVASAVMVWAILARPGSTPLTPRSRPPEKVPAMPISMEGTALKGAPTAQVAMIEFLDYQCPFCSRFAEQSLAALARQYIDSGILLYGVRHLPLDAIHPHAFEAAEIAVCADAQGRFWDVHEAFLRAPLVTKSVDFVERATQFLDPVRLKACRDAPQTRERVLDDVAVAKELELQSTPVFLIGRVLSGKVMVSEVIRGARSLQEFRLAIENALVTARPVPGIPE